MSIESVARALQPRGLSATQKLVLIGIANHDGDGGAWPSVATLAGYAECSERHARRTIRELEGMRLVTTAINQGGTSTTPSDRRPNRYDLHLDGGTQVSAGGGTGLSERGDVLCPPGGTQVSAEPSMNHPVTPRPDPVDNVDSVDDIPDGSLKARIKSTLERGSGHETD